MKFIMNKSDIKRGKQNDCGLCPVARCINRYFPDCGVSVGESHIFIRYLPYTTPTRVAKFIRAFDKCKKNVKPITFVIKNCELLDDQKF